jgi:hypothetical protein
MDDIRLAADVVRRTRPAASGRASCSGAGHRPWLVVVRLLSARQVTQLRGVWRHLEREPGAATPPNTDDAVWRAGLDAWLAGVISSQGQLTDTALNDLLALEAEAGDNPLARAYVARVLAAVLPTRGSEPPWYAGFTVAVREHCRQRGYRVDGGFRDRFGYRTWNIEVPNRAGQVQLSLNGETVLLAFPGGFTWGARLSARTGPRGSCRPAAPPGRLRRPRDPDDLGEATTAVSTH